MILVRNKMARQGWVWVVCRMTRQMRGKEYTKSS